jgi:hypothetical protein
MSAEMTRRSPGRGSMAVLAVAVTVTIASLPVVRRGLSRLLVRTTGTVVRTQERIR